MYRENGPFVYFFLVRPREIQSGAKHDEEKKWKFCCKSLSLKRLTNNTEKDKEYEHLPSEFYYPGERLDENSNQTSVEASRTTESQDGIEGFLKEQKSDNTLKKTKADMNTVARYMKENGKNEKGENLPAAELDHFLCDVFMNIREKNGQEHEPDSISLPNSSRLSHGQGNKPQAATALEDEDEDALF